MRFSAKPFAAVGCIVLQLSIASMAFAQAAAQPQPTAGRRTAAPPTTKAATPAKAPEPKAPSALTNEDIIDMVNAKLSEEIILAAVESAPKKSLDLSPTGLIALKRGGVSDRIILALQGRSPVTQAAAPPAPATATSTPAAVTVPVESAKTDKSARSVADDPKEEKKGGGVFGVFRKIPGLVKDESASAPSTASSTVVAPTKLKNGEPAVIVTALSATDSTTRIKAFLNSKDIDFNVNPDTGRILSDWFADRRCGPGIQHCANRANVKVAIEDGKTTVRVQVMERKREGGLSEKPWHENSESRGKETAQFAAELEKFLGQTGSK